MLKSVVCNDWLDWFSDRFVDYFLANVEECSAYALFLHAPYFYMLNNVEYVFYLYSDERG